MANGLKKLKNSDLGKGNEVGHYKVWYLFWSRVALCSLLGGPPPDHGGSLTQGRHLELCYRQ